MSIDTNISKLEETIIRNVREALEKLTSFESTPPTNNEDWFNALNHASEANALIKLALERDTGMSKECVAVLRALDPLVIQAFVALRSDIPAFQDAKAIH